MTNQTIAADKQIEGQWGLSDRNKPTNKILTNLLWSPQKKKVLNKPILIETRMNSIRFLKILYMKNRRQF